MYTDDNPDYPGVHTLTRKVLKKYAWLNKRQAYVIASVMIRPDRNSDAKLIGWDSRGYPVFKDRTGYVLATNKSGNPTEPKGRVTARYEGGDA